MSRGPANGGSTNTRWARVENKRVDTATASQCDRYSAWQQVRNNLPLRVSKGLMSVNHKACGSLGTPTATYWLVSFCPANF